MLTVDALTIAFYVIIKIVKVKVYCDFLCAKSTFIHHRIVNFTALFQLMKTHYLLMIFLLLLSSCKNTEKMSGTEKKDSVKKKILTGVSITAVKVESFPKYAHTGEKWDAYAPFATDPDVCY